MTIPLDRLYLYVERQAQQIWNGHVLIYRFYPHGSKDFKDLSFLNDDHTLDNIALSPRVYCNDQEPLDWGKYQSATNQSVLIQQLTNRYQYPKQNFRDYPLDIWDWAVLLHSEQGGRNLAQYQQGGFIGVHYWSHAIIARDWFRYADNILQNKQIKKTFLIYNRAWSGTREYRLKLADMLIDKNLLQHCHTWINSHDPDQDIHYKDYNFKNQHWRPKHVLENYFLPCKASSACSADFDLSDYESTQIEVVLETLFDDDRIHLTEKILRPIALGQPFVLIATAGSLAYLQRYGFKTFDTVWAENYDQIEDSYERLDSVVNVLEQIAGWDPQEKIHAMRQAQDIADYNKKRFFSKEFEQEILSELDSNLQQAFEKLRTENTSARWMSLYKIRQLLPNQQCKDIEQSLSLLNQKTFFNYFTEQHWKTFYLIAKKYFEKFQKY